MSCEDARWPGFWKSVNNASNSKTIMTQRAKLRRLAFIDFPSWSRGSRPYVLRTYPWVTTSNPPVDHISNLGAARLAAKGTTQDYLTYFSAIPVQIMAPKPPFTAVVKGHRRQDCGRGR